MTERILRWYGITHGLRSVSLRYFNAAGASADSRIGEDWRQSLNLIPVVMKATLGQRPPVQVFGNDYPTPDGTASATTSTSTISPTRTSRRSTTSPPAAHSTALNVGTGSGSSVMEVIAATERLSGRPVPWQRAPRRAGDPVADLRRPDVGRTSARLAARSTASTTSSPRRGTGTARISTATTRSPSP